MGHQFPARLQDYLVNAVEVPFKEQGLEVKRTDVYDEDFGLFDCAAIVALMSDNFQGSFILSVDRSLLESSHPMGQAGIELNDALLGDWLGELANLVVGKIKLFLAGHGINARISPPSVERNVEKVMTDYAGMKPSQRLWFAVGSDSVVCQLGGEYDQNVDFESEPTAMYM